MAWQPQFATSQDEAVSAYWWVCQDETINIQDIEQHAQSKLSKPFRLTTENSEFAKPVPLTFVLTESKVEGVCQPAREVHLTNDQKSFII